MSSPSWWTSRFSSPAGIDRFERGGQAAVDEPVGHRGLAAQQSQLAVGADEADELDRWSPA